MLKKTDIETIINRAWDQLDYYHQLAENMAQNGTPLEHIREFIVTVGWKPVNTVEVAGQCLPENKLSIGKIKVETRQITKKQLLDLLLGTPASLNDFQRICNN